MAISGIRNNSSSCQLQKIDAAKGALVSKGYEKVDGRKASLCPTRPNLHQSVTARKASNSIIYLLSEIEAKLEKVDVEINEINAMLPKSSVDKLKDIREKILAIAASIRACEGDLKELNQMADNFKLDADQMRALSEIQNKKREIKEKLSAVGQEATRRIMQLDELMRIHLQMNVLEENINVVEENETSIVGAMADIGSFLQNLKMATKFLEKNCSYYPQRAKMVKGRLEELEVRINKIIPNK